MIAEAEIRRWAARWGVDPMVVDLDYSLGWFLAALASADPLAHALRFKGGTCLRKCYFADYRFSEDLDFTAVAHMAPDTLLESVQRATRWVAEHDGPDYAAASPRFEVVEDEYGSETYQVRVYYRGPLRWGGSPRAIRLDVTRDEALLLPAAPRRLIHVYTDADSLEQVELPCYALEEILAEKIRAVSGQRRFAISRDLYDIHRLVQAGVSVDKAVALLSAKFAARGVDPVEASVDRIQERRDALEEDWMRRLSYLVTDASAVTFASAWQTTLAVLRQARAGMK